MFPWQEDGPYALGHESRLPADGALEPSRWQPLWDGIFQGNQVAAAIWRVGDGDGDAVVGRQFPVQRRFSSDGSEAGTAQRRSIEETGECGSVAPVKGDGGFAGAAADSVAGFHPVGCVPRPAKRALAWGAENHNGGVVGVRVC